MLRFLPHRDGRRMMPTRHTPRQEPDSELHRRPGLRACAASASLTRGWHFRFKLKHPVVADHLQRLLAHTQTQTNDTVTCLSHWHEYSQGTAGRSPEVHLFAGRSSTGATELKTPDTCRRTDPAQTTTSNGHRFACLRRVQRAYRDPKTSKKAVIERTLHAAEGPAAAAKTLRASWAHVLAN